MATKRLVLGLGLGVMMASAGFAVAKDGKGVNLFMGNYGYVL